MEEELEKVIPGAKFTTCLSNAGLRHAAIRHHDPFRHQWHPSEPLPLLSWRQVYKEGRGEPEYRKMDALLQRCLNAERMKDDVNITLQSTLTS